MGRCPPGPAGPADRMRAPCPWGRNGGSVPEGSLTLDGSVPPCGHKQPMPEADRLRPVSRQTSGVDGRDGVAQTTLSALCGGQDECGVEPESVLEPGKVFTSRHGQGQK